MSATPLPRPLSKLAGIGPARATVPHNSRLPDDPGDPGTGGTKRRRRGASPRGDQERLAAWISDLTTLHGLTERLGHTTALGDALHETLRAGASLLGARRGLLTLRPAEGIGSHRVTGLGLSPSDLGHLETGPPFAVTPAGTGPDGTPLEAVHPDIAADTGLGPRRREVAALLGCAASYALPLATERDAPPLGTAAWLFDEPGAPEPRQRRLLSLYLRYAAQHIANRLELAGARSALRAVHDALLPGAPAPLPGVALAARRPGHGGGFYDTLALPDGSLTLAIGAAVSPGPGALAAAGALRAGMRAYAVMEGEDPVAVLSDLELLLRLTDPGRPATALFCYAEPPGPQGTRRVTVASAGHPPPLLLGPARTEFADTALSAPLGMLACWEAPSTQVDVAKGETVLLYGDALLRRTGRARDAAFDLLRSAAAAAAPAVRDDPAALLAHLTEALAPPGSPAAADSDEAVLLAVRF